MSDQLRSKWGDPRDAQIEATYYGERTIPVPARTEKTLFGGTREVPATTRKEYGAWSTTMGHEVPDDVRADRKFHLRCGLVKAFTLIGPKGTTVQFIFDGYGQERISSHRVETFFADGGEVPELNEAPVAVVSFEGSGPRYGELINYRVTRVELWFKDRAQLAKYMQAVVLAPQAEPKPDGQSAVVQQQGGGDGWVLPLAAGLILGLWID